ncbi:hypothetical protein PCAR4_60071 [Paraburkholderia caribensis]|nr:hypothetical protein PCAR4_60071 [Paraburkholderia caribensis]
MDAPDGLRSDQTPGVFLSIQLPQTVQRYSSWRSADDAGDALPSEPIALKSPCGGADDGFPSKALHASHGCIGVPRVMPRAQLLRDVFATNGVGACCTLSLPHLGHFSCAVACSATCSACSNFSPQLSQRY